MLYKTLLLVFTLSITTLCYGQKQIAITIDDVPNTKQYEKDNYRNLFLSRLDSLAIPVAVFINEGLIYKGTDVSKGFSLLNDWISRPYVTLGNHSFSHLYYSTAGYDTFTADIIKGEAITRELAKKHKKGLNFFRFPFNDLGSDSLQHDKIEAFLTAHNYKVTPFTVESSDWMFGYIYDYYLNTGAYEKAKETGHLYIQKTLEYLEFFEQLTDTIYGRDIKHIYLCHDNRLNADFLPLLVQRLKERDYEFISLGDALTDAVYRQEDTYDKKWGISWLYRYMSTQEERVDYMKKGPDMSRIIKEYESLQKATK